MKAAVIKSPGVIAVEEVPTPKPAAGEVLLKVDMAALCGTDQRVLRGEKHVDVSIIGHEIAATVVALGKGAAPELLNTRVAVQTVVGCGLCRACRSHRQIFCSEGFKAIGYAWDGGFAEYMIMPRLAVEQGCLIPLPDDMSSAVGTMLEPISCCVNGLRHLPIESMQHVAIMGAGIIGVFNGLVAKARGAKTVSMINRSQPKLDLIKNLGLPFDHLINSSETDAVAWINEITAGRGVDGVVCSASAKSLVDPALHMLAMGGHLSLFAGFDKANPYESIDLNVIHYKELHVHGANSSVRRDYLDAIDLIESGGIDPEALATHTFALGDINDAIRAQADPDVDSLKILVKP
ncbi:MAG: L-iditol 2-dehydrogenase [Kiritimatiellia bacterium]|jgi:L-iditol 2-dehydrogenase